MQEAPLYSDLAEGPSGGAAWWVHAQDGCRLRIAHWPGDARPGETGRGTVLLFPGRTEYIEKYGRTAAELAARGYGTLAIDWRGQGLSDRLLDNRLIGHVRQFGDYQHDVAAVLATAEALDLPRPWHLLAHSMGGCIGLRAVMEGLDVTSCCFSAPMWGITLPPGRRPAAWALGWTSGPLGFGHVIAPETRPEAYVLAQPFGGNALTRDREMYEMMRRQLTAVPDLALGGPSIRWVFEALREMLTLAARPAPQLPCLTFLGSAEKIVDPQRIANRMASWPGGRLERIDRAEHEVLMEVPATRARVLDLATAHFDSHQQAQDNSDCA